LPFVLYQFGDFSLHCGKFELCRKGRRLKLERKPLELLILLVTNHGQVVTRDEIAGRLWEREVFVDIEHGINTAIRKIRQILGDSSDLPQFVQTISGSGYRFIAPVTAVEPAVTEPTQPSGDPVDLTPAPPEISATTPVIPSATRPRQRLWLVTGLCISVLAATSILTLGPHPLATRMLHRNTQPAITSLAVIPLDNLSGDHSQEYFADGMTDELTTMLAKDSTLRIVSRTSAGQFKDAHRSLPEIARDLHVDGILEGSVSRASGQVHMTLQLIRAETDTHIWAESYDRDNNDVSALPDEAARAIAKRLGSAVAPSVTPRYVNPEAHDAYLHGLYLWYNTSNPEAGQYFRKAVELQPDYAQGWTGVASYFEAGAVGGGLKPAESLAPAEAAAIKAVHLDDSLPEAHLAMCATIFFNHWDWARADKEILRAIELDPKYAEAYHLRARMLQALNRHDESIAMQEKSTELDPFARPWGMAEALVAARKYDAALNDIQLRLKSVPQDWYLLYLMFVSFHNKGMDNEAAKTYQKMLQSAGRRDSVADVQRAFQRGGYRALVQWELNDLGETAKNHYVPPGYFASLYAQLGDREHTLALLEEGYRQHSPSVLWIQSDPSFDFLHADPRYRSLIQKMGLPPMY
jgi:TolB-like protein/DNA-binding winged helix-turn-helix (wHTH) protein